MNLLASKGEEEKNNEYHPSSVRPDAPLVLFCFVWRIYAVAGREDSWLIQVHQRDRTHAWRVGYVCWREGTWLNTNDLPDR